MTPGVPPKDYVYANARSQYNLKPVMVIYLVAKMEAKWRCQLLVIDCIVSNKHSLLQNMNLRQHGTIVSLNGIPLATWISVLQSVLMLEHSKQWLAQRACNMGPMLVGQPHEACRVYVGPGSIGVVLSKETKNAQFCHKGLQLLIMSMAHSCTGLIPGVHKKLASSQSQGQLAF
jgi:hypothetical protein